MSSLIEKILERLQAGTEEAANLLGIMFSGYHSAYRKMWRSIKYGPKKFDTDWAEWYRERKRFSNLLSRLKKEGFIRKQNTERGENALWRITKKGTRKLQLIRKEQTNPFSLRRARYQKSPKRTLTLIVFDIPEREEQKRRWLRACLRNLGFSLLQKSVWIGEHALSEDFVRDLRKYRLLRYVHILGIRKRGSIEKIS